MLGGIAFGVLSPKPIQDNRLAGCINNTYQQLLKNTRRHSRFLHNFRKIASARQKHLSIRLTNCRFKALRWKKHSPTQHQLCFDLLVALELLASLFLRKNNSKYKSKHVLSSILFFAVGKYVFKMILFTSSSFLFGGEQADSGFDVLSRRRS